MLRIYIIISRTQLPHRLLRPIVGTQFGVALVASASVFQHGPSRIQLQ